jgi:aminoglycoside 2''-phosphotransferase
LTNPTLDDYLPRIRSMLPGIVIDSARMVTVGAHNNAVLVTSPDGNMVFRFAKNENGIVALRRELVVLDALKGRTPVDVPAPVLREPDAIVYPMLEGEPLTPLLLMSLDEPIQQRLAEQMGAFLRELHSTPKGLPVPDASGEDKDLMFSQIHAELQEKLYPYMAPHQRLWAERLFADGAGLYAAVPKDQLCRLIYNDFKIGHVLYDPLAQKLSGILDFGIACYDVPDIDICNLMQCFGETFVTRMFATYPEVRPMLPRARSGVWVMELMAIMEGFHEKNPYKLCVNVGMPRDIRFPILE